MNAVHIATGAAESRRTLVRDGLIVALTSAKGSPGVTTTAVGLAACWLRPGGLVVEADPAGGDLAARFGRYCEPGLSTMAVDGRDPGGGLEPGRWVQPLPYGGGAVLAPPGAAASASLATLGARTGLMLELLAGRHPLVVVDAGRWWHGSPAEPALAAADLLLVLARPQLDELRQLEDRLPALRRLAGKVRLVLCGETGWPAGEVGRQLGVPVAGVLPVDRHGAAVLSGRSVPRRGWASTGWTRLPLLRAYRGLAARLTPPRPAATPPVLAGMLTGQAVTR